MLKICNSIGRNNYSHHSSVQEHKSFIACRMYVNSTALARRTPSEVLGGGGWAESQEVGGEPNLLRRTTFRAFTFCTSPIQSLSSISLHVQSKLPASISKCCCSSSLTLFNFMLQCSTRAPLHSKQNIHQNKPRSSTHHNTIWRRNPEPAACTPRESILI